MRELYTVHFSCGHKNSDWGNENIFDSKQLATDAFDFYHKHLRKQLQACVSNFI